MFIRDDEDEPARQDGLPLPPVVESDRSEVHVMSTKPSSMHPPTEDANDEPREAR
jgi:hypothetical protein